MGVLSNNSPKEIGIYKAREDAPDHVAKVLSIIEEIVKEFYVTVKSRRNSTIITILDKKTTVQKEPIRKIFLVIITKPKSYLMNLYHQTIDNKNQKHIYEIKVKGDYDFKTLKANLEKLIRGKNLRHRPRFYPF